MCASQLFASCCECKAAILTQTFVNSINAMKTSYTYKNKQWHVIIDR